MTFFALNQYYFFLSYHLFGGKCALHAIESTCLLQSQARRRSISPKVAMGCEVMLPKVTNNLTGLDTQLLRSACIARKGVCLSVYNMCSLWLMMQPLGCVGHAKTPTLLESTLGSEPSLNTSLYTLMTGSSCFYEHSRVQSCSVPSNTELQFITPLCYSVNS